MANSWGFFKNKFAEVFGQKLLEFFSKCPKKARFTFSTTGTFAFVDQKWHFNFFLQTKGQPPGYNEISTFKSLATWSWFKKAWTSMWDAIVSFSNAAASVWDFRNRNIQVERWSTAFIQNHSSDNDCDTGYFEIHFVLIWLNQLLLSSN